MAVTGIGDYNNAYENVYTEAAFSKDKISSQGRGFQGVAISPAYLAKAGKNEDTAKDLDEMLSGVEKAYNWLKNSIEKDGNKLISCGYYIDENGKMGSYSVVEKKHSMFDSLEVQSEKDAERIKELRKKSEIFGHSLEISQESKEFMAGVKERKAAQIAAMEAAKPKENGNVFERSYIFCR